MHAEQLQGNYGSHFYCNLSRSPGDSFLFRLIINSDKNGQIGFEH
jgi:hypothetical protein